MIQQRLLLTLTGVLFLSGFSATADLYVAPSAKGLGDCSSQANACTLQTALSTAQSNSDDDNLLLEPGTYDLSPQNEYLSDNGDTGSVIVIKALDPSNRPVFTGDGLMINTDTGGDGGDAGGDVYISDLIFETQLWVRTSDGNISIKNTVFRNSSVYSYIYGYYSTTKFYNNVVKNNPANNGLGGVMTINTVSGTIYIYNNLFFGNKNVIGSGAVYTFNNGGKVYIYNNTFFNNTGKLGGALQMKILDDIVSDTYIYNNIFWNNSASQGGNDGDDIYVNSDGDSDTVGTRIQLFNNIIGANSDVNTAQSEDLFISHTDQYTQGNNILQDPKFLNETGEDLRISKDSPAIDSGTDTIPGLINFPLKDIRGEDRIKDGNDDTILAVDIGAYEYTKSIDIIQPPPQASGGGGGGCGGGCSVVSAGQSVLMLLFPLVLMVRRAIKGVGNFHFLS